MQTVGIVACSNPQTGEEIMENRALKIFLEAAGNQVLTADSVRIQEGNCLDGGKARAEQLMALFQNPEVREIYDVSGGDMANQVLDYLNFPAIQKSQAEFWGYSDLTAVINAIYTKTGKSSVLYTARNLVRGAYQDLQRRRFLNREALFSPSFSMLQGPKMEGILVGGNIRCFLKLAGTPYFPDLHGKILFLEARSGRVPQMITYLSQLRSMGAFSEISGIALGTFSQMEAEDCKPDIVSLVRSFAGTDLPIAKTEEVGHGADTKALRIGRKIRI